MNNDNMHYVFKRLLFIQLQQLKILETIFSGVIIQNIEYYDN